MCDTHAASFVGQDLGPGTLMVDGGYHNDVRYIRPDGSDTHKRQRARIERVFGRSKMDSKAIGGVCGGFYRLKKDRQPLIVRAAYLLQNLKKIHGTNQRVIQ